MSLRRAPHFAIGWLIGWALLGCDQDPATAELQQGGRTSSTASPFALEGYYDDALCDRIEEVARDRGETLAEVRRLASQASCDTPPAERAHASVPALMEALYQTIPFVTGSRTLAVLAYDSDSPQPASATHPRLILFDGFQTLMAVQANYQGDLRSQQINNNTIEVLHYDCENAEWRPYLIREEVDASEQPCLRMYDENAPYGIGQQPLKTHCQHCHSQSVRPIWDDIPLWPKLVGTQSKDLSSISLTQKNNDELVFAAANAKSGFYDILSGIEQTIRQQEARNVTEATSYINGQIGVTLGFLQAHRVARKLHTLASSYDGHGHDFLRLWASLDLNVPARHGLSQQLRELPAWQVEVWPHYVASARAFIEGLCSPPSAPTWCADPQALYEEFQRFSAATPNRESEPRGAQTFRARLAASDQSKVTRAQQAYEWAFNNSQEVFSIREAYSIRGRWVEEAKWAFLASKLQVPESEVHSWFHVLLPLRENRLPWDIQTGDRELQTILAGHLKSWMQNTQDKPSCK
jgi:hypothetical protein